MVRASRPVCARGAARRGVRRAGALCDVTDVMRVACDDPDMCCAVAVSLTTASETGANLWDENAYECDGRRLTMHVRAI